MTRMALAAHRASDRGASGDRRRLPESVRDRRASTECVGAASAGKTGQGGDHRVGRGKTGQHGQPQPQKPFYEGKGSGFILHLVGHCASSQFRPALKSVTSKSDLL